LTSHTAPRESEFIKQLQSMVRRGLRANTAPRDSEIINELLSRVMRGFNSPNSL
jgi:hypothetical protein